MVSGYLVKFWGILDLRTVRKLCYGSGNEYACSPEKAWIGNIASSRGILGGMDFEPLPINVTPTLPSELTDEDLQNQAPGVRGQLLRRLETIWAYCEDEIEASKLEQRSDPRFADLGLRAIDRIAKLYRLDKVPAPVTDEHEEVSAVEVARTRDMVLRSLEELESRAGGTG